MKLLEEKGLRNKIINECIRYENELQRYYEIKMYIIGNTPVMNEKIDNLLYADKVDFAKQQISELRTRLLVLLDNEKVE